MTRVDYKLDRLVRLVIIFITVCIVLSLLTERYEPNWAMGHLLLGYILGWRHRSQEGW